LEKVGLWPDIIDVGFWDNKKKGGG